MYMYEHDGYIKLFEPLICLISSLFIILLINATYIGLGK